MSHQGDAPVGAVGERVDARPWVIDLAALERADAASAADGARARRRARRWTVVAVLSLGIASAAVTTAVVTAQRGAQWRDIALQQSARADAMAARVEEASRAVAAAEDAADDAESARRAAEDALAVAEGRIAQQDADLAALEQRIAALAAEKARLEDDRVVTGSRRLVARPDAGLVACREDGDAWLRRRPGAPADAVGAWLDEAATGDEPCRRVLTTGRR